MFFITFIHHFFKCFIFARYSTFNDLTISSGIIWGKVVIDTIKEVITLSNISKKAASEIETEVTEMMMREKKKYGKLEKDLCHKH